MSVGIIIPTKNQPRQLEICLASLIPNECNFRVYVMDDGSRHEGAENSYICENYTQGGFLQVMHYYLHESNTPGQCLFPIKKGIEECDNDYIKIVGSDDYLEPYVVDYEYNFIRKHRDKFDAVVTSYVNTDEEFVPLRHGVYKVAENINIDMMRVGCFIPDAMMVDRYFFNGVTWDHSIGSGWLWRIWFEMLCSGLRVYSIPDKVTYRYRHHGRQMSLQPGYKDGRDKLPEIFKRIEAEYAVSNNGNNGKSGDCSS